MSILERFRERPLLKRFRGQERELNWTTDGDVLWDEIRAIKESFPIIDEYSDECKTIYLCEITHGAYWLMVMLEEGEDYINSYADLEEAKEAFEELKKTSCY